MSDRRYEVYEVRECEHGELKPHPGDNYNTFAVCRPSHTPLSSIPDDLVEKAAKAIDRRDETWLRDGGDHRFIHSTTLARAALSVLFPKETR